MKVKRIDFNNSNGEITLNTSITCFKGNYCEQYMLLIEAMTGTYRRDVSASISMPRESMIHSCVEIDKKNYDICYIYTVDAKHTMGVNFIKGKRFFSLPDTIEYEEKRRTTNINTRHVFTNKTMCSSMLCLPSSEKARCSFENFLIMLKEDTKKGDCRPIFIYDYFDRLDESEDISSYLNELATLGRQVFISVCSNYPTEKMLHNEVQIIEMDADDDKN